MTNSRDWILWLDCMGGILVGLLVLAMHPWLSWIEGLPRFAIVLIGTANLAYGVFSLFVTTRKRRPLLLMTTLALANVGWLFVCLGILLYWIEGITGLGVVLVLGEGLYVAALGIMEWRWRAHLSTQPDEKTG